MTDGLQAPETGLRAKDFNKSVISCFIRWTGYGLLPCAEIFVTRSRNALLHITLRFLLARCAPPSRESTKEDV
jgi:hypothetical protein